jgi:hypothetical protein
LKKDGDGCCNGKKCIERTNLFLMHFILYLFTVLTYFSNFALDNTKSLIKYGYIEEASTAYLLTKIFWVVLIVVIAVCLIKTNCFKKFIDLLSYNPLLLKCNGCFWEWGIVDMKSTNAPYEEYDNKPKKTTGVLDSISLKKTYGARDFC